MQWIPCFSNRVKLVLQHAVSFFLQSVSSNKVLITKRRNGRATILVYIFRCIPKLKVFNADEVLFRFQWENRILKSKPTKKIGGDSLKVIPNIIEYSFHPKNNYCNLIWFTLCPYVRLKLILNSSVIDSGGITFSRAVTWNLGSFTEIPRTFKSTL